MSPSDSRAEPVLAAGVLWSPGLWEAVGHEVTGLEPWGRGDAFPRETPGGSLALRRVQTQPEDSNGTPDLSLPGTHPGHDLDLHLLDCEK